MSLLQAPILPPFSPSFFTSSAHRSLLLQFFCHTFLAIHSARHCCGPLAPVNIKYLPYDWAIDTNPVNTAYEYACLLPIAFPKKQRIAHTLLKGLNQLPKIKTPLKPHLQKLYHLLEKLFEECQKDENLLFFLLKNKAAIDSLMGSDYLYHFLLKIYPKGLSSLEEMLCDHYHERGFFSLIPELKDLILALNHD